MTFVQAMNSHKNEFVQEMNSHKKGVNGANVYTEDGVGDERVTLFTMLNRDLDEEYIRKAVAKIAFRNQTHEIRDLFVMAFQTRDVRGGKGEKKLFYQFMNVLNRFWPLKVMEMLTLIPEYGCWRDMWELWTAVPSLTWRILEVVKKQFMEDLVKAGADQKGMSLLAKWLPREKSSTYKALVYPIAKALYPNELSERRQIIRYRKETSFMNSALKTAEINMCGGTWRKIIPDNIPGRSMKLHNKAFLNIKRGTADELRYPDRKDREECREHFMDYVAKLASGEKKAHGAHVIMPHQLVMKIRNEVLSAEEHIVIQAQWDSIREETLRLGGLGKAVVMCDFSGSMEGRPLEISTALGVLISECTHPSFKDHILTFDSTPKWHSFIGQTTLKSKLDALNNCGQGLNTDFYKACHMILERMVTHRVPVNEAPEDLIVITDMGFDEAAASQHLSSSSKHSIWETQLNRIRYEFKEAGEFIWGEGNGWKAPRIVIWNVSAAFKDFYATANEEGVVQLSGWSPSILKVLQQGGLEIGTPYMGMRAALDDARYDAVRSAFDLTA